MSDGDVVVGIILEEACFSVDELASLCAVEPAWIVRRVEEGLIASLSGASDDWRFGAAALRRARRIREVERAFDAEPELAALVADLLDEMDAMRATLRRRGL